MPSYIIERVQRYGRDILLMITQQNSVEFVIGALSLKLNDERHYRLVLQGVQLGCNFIRALRQFAEDVELSIFSEERGTSTGELGSLLAEMNELLSLPRIASIPNKETSGVSLFKVLRLDQISRMRR